MGSLRTFSAPHVHRTPDSWPQPTPARHHACSSTRQRTLAHAALQWQAVQALAGYQGALVRQVASVASGFRQDAPREGTVLYHGFIHLLACLPGALRDSPWLQLIMPVFVDHFRVRASCSCFGGSAAGVGCHMCMLRDCLARGKLCAPFIAAHL